MSQIPEQLLKDIEAKNADNALEDKAGEEAASKLFPGSSKDAFRVFNDIEIEKFKVRMFYDGDFDVLQSINHPLIAWVETKAGERESKIPPARGKTAWQIMWLLTTPIEEIEQRLEQGTLKDDFEKLPRKIFGRLRVEALARLYGAIYDQFNIYWDSGASFRNKDSEKENGEAGSTQGPPP